MSGSGSIGRGVAIQSDGKIVVVGKATDGTGTGRYGLIVERFNSNGSVDGSFGSGGVARFLNANFGDGYGIAIQSDHAERDIHAIPHRLEKSVVREQHPIPCAGEQGR